MKSKKNIKSIIVMTLIAILSLMFLNMSLAANTAKIIVETANLRETASSESIILEQMSENEEVEIIEKSNDWYKVDYKGITGYVKADLISTESVIENVLNAENVSQTTENAVNNTTETATEATTETAVPEQSEQATQTQTDAKEGTYIVQEDSKLKLVPLINATDTIDITKDQKVNVTKIMNGWALVELDITKGWVRIEKIKSEEIIKQEQEQAAQEAAAKAAAEAAAEAEANAVAIKTSYVKSTSVNLRKEANTTSEVLKTLVQNTAVEVLSQETEWSKVRVNGTLGYISTPLLSDTKIEETTARSSSTARTANTTTSSAPVVSTSAGNSSVTSYAQQFIGCSYVYGAAGPNSFDCSGFTSYIYKQFGVSLSRTAQAQYSNGVAVSSLQAGDLVMFGSSASNIWHVGIYIGGNQFIHAANKSSGVRIDSLASGYYANNYVGARRVM